MYTHLFLFHKANKSCPLDFNWLTIFVKQSYDKVKEVTLSKVIWRLLLKVSTAQFTALVK